MPNFFVSCQLGSEDVLLQEMNFFWHKLIDLDGLPTRSRPEILSEEKGGLEIKCELHLGLQINLFSKMANRVLLRVHQFEARYFDQFEKEIKKMNWNQFVDLKKPFKFEVDSAKSRLFHEGNLLEVLEKTLKVKNSSDETAQKIFIRIFKDSVQISLDTSGDHLHKRGYRKQQGEAPMRETLAYQMVHFLAETSRNLNLPYLQSDKNIIYIDPFCGSGTLLFEIRLANVINFMRSYAFESFSFLPALFKSPVWKKNYKFKNIFNNRLLGIEIDSATFDKAISNLKNLPIEDQNQIEILNQDCQDLVLQTAETDFKIILTNPPYGGRLSDIKADAILQYLEEKIDPDVIVVVHPKDWSFKFKKLKLSRQKAFNNQGLDLHLSYFSKELSKNN